MRSPIKQAPWVWFLGFALLFSLQVIPRIFNESPTNDEPLELTNGYFYWTGDVLTHNHHPPLPKMLQSLPLKFMSLQEDIPPSQKENQLRAYYFFFVSNKGRFESMLRGGRLVTLLLGLGIGFLLFFQTRKWPFAACLTATALWAFHPTILAYSGLAIADIPATFFFLASVLAFQKHLEKPGVGWAVLSGGLTGLAACCKFSALALIPLFVFLEALPLFQKKRKNLAGTWTAKAQDWAWGTVGFLCVVSLLYLPGTLAQPEHRLPWLYFLAGLKNLMDYSNYHHPFYFLGGATRQNNWFYFPTVFILKNTLPFLLLIAGTLLLGWHRKIALPAWMAVTPFYFFLCILPVQNLGVRYLLPAYPFFILIIARIAGEVWKEKPRRETRGLRWGLMGLLVWHAATSLASEPNMISYFNDLIPPEKKIQYLADCDLDMGQDVKRLAETGRQRGWKRVKLAQFGGALDPSFYGLDWNSWTQKDLSCPQPGWVYAVNVTLFQTGPIFGSDLLPIAQGWAFSTPPTGRVGDTWIYFEIPGNPQPDSSPSLSSVRIF